MAIALLGPVYHLQVIESEKKEHAPQTACSQKEEKRIPNISFKNSLSRLSLYPREGPGNPVFLPGEYHGQGSMAGYSPYGCKELDTTEVTLQGMMLKLKLQYFGHLMRRVDSLKRL